MYIQMYIYNMAHRYSIADARSCLPTIIDQAEAGQEIELTRRGQPVAVVVSCQTLERLRGRRPVFGNAYRAFLAQHSLTEIGVEDARATFPRDRNPGRKVVL